jgi:hypothetical protein
VAKIKYIGQLFSKMTEKNIKNKIAGSETLKITASGN